MVRTEILSKIKQEGRQRVESLVTTLWYNNTRLELHFCSEECLRYTVLQQAQVPVVQLGTCAVHHWEYNIHSYPPHSLSLALALPVPSLRYGPPCTAALLTHTQSGSLPLSSPPPLLSVYGDQKYAELKDREGWRGSPGSVSPPFSAEASANRRRGRSLLSAVSAAHSAHKIVPRRTSRPAEKKYTKNTSESKYEKISLNILNYFL